MSCKENDLVSAMSMHTSRISHLTSSSMCIIPAASRRNDDRSGLLQTLFGWDLCGSATSPLRLLINRLLYCEGDVYSSFETKHGGHVGFVQAGRY